MSNEDQLTLEPTRSLKRKTTIVTQSLTEKYKTLSDFHCHPQRLKEITTSFILQFHSSRYFLKRYQSEFSPETIQKTISKRKKNLIEIFTKDKSYLDKEFTEYVEEKFTKILSFSNLDMHLQIEQYKLKILNRIHDLLERNDKEIYKINIFLENFILFLVNVFCFYTGLSCCFYINTHGKINLEFYADDQDDLCYSKLLNRQFYPLQLKLNPDFTSKEKNFEDLDFNNGNYFPPYMIFRSYHKDYFRKFNANEEPLVESEGESKEAYDPNTRTSILRSIDKLRIIQNEFVNIFDNKEIERTPMFHRTLIIRNNIEIEKRFQVTQMISEYKKLLNHRGELRILNFFRNFLGEEIGLYFLFQSLKLNWLLIPSIIGVILQTVYFILSYKDHFQNVPVLNEFLEIKNYQIIINTLPVIIWSCLFTIRLKSAEDFYSYIWGMKDYLPDPNRNNRLHLESYTIIEGLKIPNRDRVRLFLRRSFTYLLTILLILFVILVNLAQLVYIKAFDYSAGSQLAFIRKMQFGNQVHDMKIANSNFTYLSPLLFMLIRAMLSKLNKMYVKWSLKFNQYRLQEDYNSNYMLKIFLFELFNEYFSYFYLIWDQNSSGACNSKCFSEIKWRLDRILSWTLLLSVALRLQYYLRTKASLERIQDMNGFDKKDLRLNYEYKENKVDFVTHQYIDSLIWLGYVILFGSVSPLCFVLVFARCYVERIFNAYYLVRLSSTNTVNAARGYGMLYTLMMVLSLIGIVSNVTMFFTVTDFNLDKSTKWSLVVLVANCIMLLYKLPKFDFNPYWFKYAGLIRANVLRKVRERIED